MSLRREGRDDSAGQRQKRDGLRSVTSKYIRTERMGG